MNKVNAISESGLMLEKHSESFRSHPYKCPAGVWTIGYGTTWYFDTKKHVTEHDAPITEPEADRLLRGHINTVFAPLADKLCRDNLNQNQFDAVVDFLYNCGATYIDKSGKLRYYNLFEHINNYMPEAELRAYWEGLCITANGVRENGLLVRRMKEVELFYKN